MSRACYGREAWRDAHGPASSTLTRDAAHPCFPPHRRPRCRSYLTIIKRVTGKKGIAGTLDGFFPWGMAQAVAKGAVFSYGQAACAKALHGTEGLTKETKTVISGGVGGLVQGIVMSPLLLLKTRVMTDPAFRASGGVVATAIASAKVGGRLIATEGPQVLFKGVSIFAFKRAADWSTR